MRVWQVPTKLNIPSPYNSAMVMLCVFPIEVRAMLTQNPENVKIQQLYS
jgi:hypothetical protein